MMDQWMIPNPREHLYVAASTVCNLRCRFCGYAKSSLPRRTMPTELFRSVIDRACAFGYDTFGLTPLIGEVLTDPEFSLKLAFLDAHPGVTGYAFNTNFIGAVESFIRLLIGLRKLRFLVISIYGHDAASFCRLTRASADQWQCSLDNLALLASLIPADAGRYQVCLCAERSYTPERCDPALHAILARLRAAHVGFKVRTSYTNWGGLITAEDVAEVDVAMAPEIAERRSPCAILFYKNIVLPDGRMNACACRDANATLVIGDLTRQSFEEIFSARNSAYRTLINEQLAGHFRPPCRSCTMYRSLAEHHSTYRHHRKPFIPLARYWDALA